MSTRSVENDREGFAKLDFNAWRKRRSFVEMDSPLMLQKEPNEGKESCSMSFFFQLKILSSRKQGLKAIFMF